MDFYERVDHVADLLRSRRRVTYRSLKEQFDLDEAGLEGLKEELFFSHPEIKDESDRGLTWTDEASLASPLTSAPISTPTPHADTGQERELVAYTPQYLAEKILSSKGVLEGERKQVTVLFADIKGSTELIEDLDPEDAQRLLDPALHHMMDAVYRYEGTVNQVLGDGIMALFGAPIAHEDHALRACYAALAMQAAMRDYTAEVRRAHGLEMPIRVGLNSGEVVVRTIGTDLHMEYSAVGQTTHLAARMEQLSTPGSVRLTGSTHRLVEGFVRVHALGLVPVKGLTDPVEVFDLQGASTIRRRIQAAVARGLTQFVGRETELEGLNQARERAAAGHGQVVAAVGEAGVGKSRLVYEFIESHRSSGWLVLESASMSYGKATPYFPVVDLLKRYVHAEDGDEPRTIRAKVTGQVVTLDDSFQDAIPALLFLLDALPEESAFAQLDPPVRRERTLEALKRVLLRESDVQPLLLVFEDLHWIDSETQALLDRLVESLPTSQLLLLVNYRPEYEHCWGSNAYFTQLRLDPLPPESADAFLDALLGSDASLAALKPVLIERTEGNPFFLEEMVQTLVETAHLVGESGAYCLARDLPALQAPPTVQAILAARIDRLAPNEKQLLQTAAVIGAEAPLLLLQAVCDIDEATLHACLTRLQEAKFLYETSLFPDHLYAFKHALTQEVAYGSLLNERRRALHARIVGEADLQTMEPDPERVQWLAQHAFRGEVWDKVVVYARQAGDRSLLQSALREAVIHYEWTLEALDHLAENPEMLRQIIDVRLNLRIAFSLLGEPGRLYDQLCAAETVAEYLDDTYWLGLISCHFSMYFFRQHQYVQSFECAQRALTLMEARHDSDSEGVALTMMGMSHLGMGQYRQAIDVSRCAIVSLKGDHGQIYFGPTSPPGLIARVSISVGLAELGHIEELERLTTEMLPFTHPSEQMITRLLAWRRLGGSYVRQGDCHNAILLLERGLAFAQESNIYIHTPGMLLFLSLAYIQSGRLVAARPLVDKVLEGLTTQDRQSQSPADLSYLGEALVSLRLFDEAVWVTKELQQQAEANQSEAQRAYVQRLLGDIDLHREPPAYEQAEAHYRQAITSGQQEGLRPLMAHCHLELGRLYHATEHLEAARTEMTSSIGLYRDVGLTFKLTEAETALAELDVQ